MRITTLATAALFLFVGAIAPFGAAKAMFFGCDSPGYLNTLHHSTYSYSYSAAKKKAKRHKVTKDEYLRIAPTK
ncbi:MAG TPA: hypothetical protein VFB45_24180 [Pseudolabrys sp.]|nr:hypothetical protein [Pseudolabrys sp.]